MLKIALVGNIASGKSTIEKIISSKGHKVIDTDKISHNLLAKSETVKAMFADCDILTDNKIDRKKLANIVFNDKEKLKLLELILHPQIVTELLTIFKGPEKVIFVSAPQLFEAKMDTLFDIKIFIAANREIRLERLMKRNTLSKEDAIKRIDSQMPDEEKMKLCDYVIVNNGNLKELNAEVNEVLKLIL